ncbi:MAG: hypothetical protein C7B45_05180 [Sulfobacillus acidophilus]|uniref:Uncharacterized protein n=1 Tax=Sulfobacillus acidophilus TaxID=53633 RepID=A0A2T2WKT8_9FIRM|nr:MAG: hypothetical protein C7B45_05180 [Sulfobacillus acidophilus]
MASRFRRCSTNQVPERALIAMSQVVVLKTLAECPIITQARCGERVPHHTNVGGVSDFSDNVTPSCLLLTIAIAPSAETDGVAEEIETW